MADWPQLLSGGAIGAIVTWLGGILKTGFEHVLARRNRREDEERAVRAEQREEERKERERKLAEANKLKEDEAILLVYITQLNGTTDLPTAGDVVRGIHNFFAQRPQYLRHPANKAFLEKYPGNFREQVCYAPERFKEPTALVELKQAAEALQASTGL